MIADLFEKIRRDQSILPSDYLKKEESLDQRICYFIAGMTNRYVERVLGVVEK